MDQNQATQILSNLANLGNTSAKNKSDLHKIIQWINVLNEQNMKLKSDLNKINKTTSLKQVSYAQALNTPQTKQKEAPEQTLIIKAKPNANKDTVANIVFTSIDNIRKTKKNIKINKIIRSKTGAIIKTPTTTNIDELIEQFKAQDQLSAIAQVYKPKYLDPLIVLKSISKQQDITTISKDLCDINPQLDGLAKEIKVLFATKNTGPTHNIFIRASPKVYEIFSNNNNNLYLNYEAIRWSKTIHVKQCQNCMCFNPDHKTHECNKERMCKTCGIYGNHECTNIQKCGNCSKHPHHKDHCNHKPNNINCPLYAAQHKKTESLTCYSPITTNINNA